MIRITSERDQSAIPWNNFFDSVTSHADNGPIWAELPNLEDSQVYDLLTSLKNIPYEVSVSVIQDARGNRHSFCTTDFSADSVNVGEVYAYATNEYPGFVELLRIHNHPDNQCNPDLDPRRIRQNYPSAMDLDGASGSEVNLVIHEDGVTLYSLPAAVRENIKNSPGWITFGQVFGVYSGLLFRQLGVELSAASRKSLRKFPNQGTDQLLMIYTLGTLIRQIGWQELGGVVANDLLPGSDLVDSMQPIDLETLLTMCVDPKGIEIQRRLNLTMQL